MALLLPFFALAAPFVLWPIEQLLPYPYIVEELFKGCLVWQIIRSPLRRPVLIVALTGLLFGISETVFYLFNILLFASPDALFNRVIITIPFHITTMVVIYLPTLKNRRYILLGLLLAMGMHYLFNYFLAMR